MAANRSRAPWETSGQTKGVSLSHSNVELCIPGAKPVMSEWPASQIHEGVVGVSFLNFQSITRNASLRTKGPCLLITKGWHREKSIKLGYEEARILTTVLTLHDPVARIEEPRAVTCINIAAKSDQFFELPKVADPLKIDMADRTPIFAELRACDCTSDEWETWGNSASFQLFISNTIAAIGEPTSFVTYKVIVKEGYMCQKLHCPIDNRDQLYQKSGCNGFQFKQVREPSDPPEKGLEVMKVQFDGPISKAHEQCGSMGGFLGVFRSKSATYVRIANDNIKEARSILYKNDPRFTAFNANAKAGDLYKIQGFQAGVQIAEVVRVTETIKWPCIPMRVVNSQDLAVVYVTAATQPSHFRYPTSMGVLMISPVMTVRSAKSSGSSSSTSAPSTARSQIDSMKESKRKSEPKKAAKPMSETKTTSAPSYSQVLQNSDLEKRVSVLEGQMQNVQTKVQIIDQKCTDISSNMSAGFDKLMAAIQTMQAQSADTPVQSPIPKHQKTQK